MAVGTQTFTDFLTNQSTQIDYSYLIVALLLAVLLGFTLSKLYIKYGTSVSNRKKFASNFILLTATTTLIIMVVKSSLALSLGLVGALSIVRFRAAIKEPEELAFLFLTIAIGLGLGAGQVTTTLISFVIISFVIWGRRFVRKKDESQNLYITISGKGIELREIAEILEKNCSYVQLKRFDQLENNFLEAAFLVDFDSFSKLEKTREEINNLSKTAKIVYLDKSGFY